jgi:hypothetical protein
VSVVVKLQDGAEFIWEDSSVIKFSSGLVSGPLVVGVPAISSNDVVPLHIYNVNEWKSAHVLPKDQ